MRKDGAVGRRERSSSTEPAVFTPKDFAINDIIGDIVAKVEREFEMRSLRNP